MIRILTLIGFFSLDAALAQIDTVDEIDLHISRSLGGGVLEINRDISWITEDIRPIVVERLQKRLESEQGPGKNSERVSIESQLVSINHEPTIRRLVDDMVGKDNYNSSALDLCATEKSLYILFPALDMASSKQPEIEPGTISYPVHLVMR